MDLGKKQNCSKLFVLAAAIYMAGVVVFSGWSYFRQRDDLYAQVDQSLANATHATELILGTIFLECAVETESVHGVGYAANQAKLNHFAGDCRLDALGAVVRRGAETWTLIGGGREKGLGSPENTCFLAPLPPDLSSIVLELASSGNGCIQIKTVQIEGLGELRLAVLYHATSSDAGYALVAARSTLGIDRLQRALAMRTLLISIFLYAMAFPLIALYNRTQKRTAGEMAELNTRLRQDMIQQKFRETELEDAIRDLERFNAVTLGRENRILELKAEVNTLLEQMKRKPRYSADPANPPPPRT